MSIARKILNILNEDNIDTSKYEVSNDYDEDGEFSYMPSDTIYNGMEFGFQNNQRQWEFKKIKFAVDKITKQDKSRIKKYFTSVEHFTLDDKLDKLIAKLDIYDAIISTSQPKRGGSINYKFKVILTPHEIAAVMQRARLSDFHFKTDFKKLQDMLKGIDGVILPSDSKMEIILDREGNIADKLIKRYKALVTDYPISIYVKDTDRYIFKNNID